MADSVLTAAVAAFFGFAGVVAGAILTPLINRHLENRRDLEQATIAWALLREDAGSALRAVEERQRRGTWPTVSNQDWSSVWRSSRAALVRHVGPERFRCVAEAFERMDKLESGMNTRRSNETRGLTDADLAFLADVSVLLRKAEETLVEPLWTNLGGTFAGEAPLCGLAKARYGEQA